MSTVGPILTHALAVAVYPWALIVVAMLLTEPGGRARSSAFVAGWTAGVAALLAVLIVVNALFGANRHGEPAEWVGWVKLGLGVGIFAMAAAQARKMPAAVRGELPPPGWMAELPSLSPRGCARLGVRLVLGNPKNVSQILIGAVTIASLTPGGGARLSAAVVFVIIASLCVLVPLVVRSSSADGNVDTLNTWRDWVSRNNPAIMFVLLSLLGAKSVGDGIAQLT
ncbi:GAP family protein [Nocardia stercoris]|uniref:GAP family protein n=1 Tax=Nocardia stercoris TaxID=2483361 RepID=UPI001319D7DD|nr:GAP family protein [Nocardia stercoris]